MISVVIPLYNKSLTIRRTLESVFCQTFTDYEIIVVNDGSTDDGPRIVGSMCNEKLRIVHQDNQGVCVARNRGVQESNGAYIAFLDGDDLWHPKYLELMSDMINDNPEAGLYCSAGLGSNFQLTSRSYRVANKYQKKSQRIDFFENPFVFAHTSGSVVSKKKFIEVGGYAEGMKCCEDFRLSQIMALHYPVMFCGWPITKYVGGVPGQVTQTNPEVLKGWWKYVAQYYNDFYNEFVIIEDKKKLRAANIWLKYAMRHSLKNAIFRNDNDLLMYIFSNYKCLEMFSTIELLLYKSNLRMISLLWINLTKVVWRLHGYPIVNEKIKNREIPQEFLYW